ncbi:sugar kinase [Cytobacillus depressus]|uniref:Sugar kinase n=1 Tax=Cytobacillus depressus TaxID=1602942 RepID=A0A6L3V0N6_9BACI|nr:sugar kinase [Cytobacillus depressus]KAB2329556.1 sugar kinase [Cytobacillus depressus]
MDVVTFGETMVLFTPESIGPLRFVGKFEKTIGGAESNVAIALSRLGAEVGWISRLGDDEFGSYIRNFIRGEGVDTSQVKFDKEHPTAVFFKERQAGDEPKVYYYRKGSAASQMSSNDLDEAYIAQAKFLHISGITAALSPSCRDTVFRAIEMGRRNQLTIVFDPNIRLKLWSKEEAREVLMDIASHSDIVLPGIEEGKIMTGESSPENIAARLLKNGAKVVVVKLGEKGAYYATDEQAEYVTGFPVQQIVDTVGAGDGFAAGFLSGLIRGWSYRDAVELGNRVGAYALTVPGDVEGYPFWSQISPDEKKEEVYR